MSFQSSRMTCAYTITYFYINIHTYTAPPNENLLCVGNILNSQLLTSLFRLGIRKRIDNRASIVRSGTTTPRYVPADILGAAERQRWFSLELQRKLGG